MAVTGTEQRVYGTLVGNCQIYLDRFAIVVGSETQLPTSTATVIYGSDLYIKQCGYEHDGNMSLLYFPISTSSLPTAVFEFYICKRDRNKLVIETYGELAATSKLSMWFNQGKSPHKESSVPDWVRLNHVNTGSIMGYLKDSSTFVFKESVSANNGSTIIDCCNKCPTCKCLNCYICNRFYIKPVGGTTKTYGTSLKYGYRNLGNSSCVFKASGIIPVTSFCPYSITLDLSNYDYNLYYLDDNGVTEHLIGRFSWYQSSAAYDLVVEYTIECDQVKIWAFLNEGVVSTTTEITGKFIGVYNNTYYFGHYFEYPIASIEGDVVNIDGDNIVNDDSHVVSYYGPLVLTGTRTFSGTQSQGNIINTTPNQPPYDYPKYPLMVSKHVGVTIKFTLTHNAPITYTNSNGMRAVVGGCGTGTGYGTIAFEFTGEDTKNVNYTATFYPENYRPHGNEYYGSLINYLNIGIYYYDQFGTLGTFTVDAAIEIVDIFDGCTGESLLSKLPLFDTVGLWIPDDYNSHPYATFADLDETLNPVTAVTFDLNYFEECTALTLSGTECFTYIFDYPTPINANLWTYIFPIDTTREMTATISISPVNNKCELDTEYYWYFATYIAQCVPNTVAGRIIENYAQYANAGDELDIFGMYATDCISTSVSSVDKPNYYIYFNSSLKPTTGWYYALNATRYVGKTISFNLMMMLPYIDMSYDQTHWVSSYFSRFIRTDEIYDKSLPKYLRTLNSGCIQVAGEINGGSKHHWMIYRSGRGVTYNGLACGVISGGTLLTIKLVTDEDPGYIKILSLGKYYYVHIGLFGAILNEASLDIANNTVYVHGYNYTNYHTYAFNEDLTAIIEFAQSWCPADYRCCIFENMRFTNRLFWVIPGNTSLYTLQVFTLEGVYDPYYSGIVRNFQGHAVTLGSMSLIPFNGHVLFFTTDYYSSNAAVYRFNSLEDPGTYLGLVDVSRAQPNSCCEHNGKLYAASWSLGTSTASIYEFDEDSVRFIDKGIPLPRSLGGCLISHGEYLIVISTGWISTTQEIPQINIIPNSML